MNYDIIKSNYKRGLWSKEMVKVAVKKNIITQEQFKEITALDSDSDSAK
jgi:hypothetical protein